MATDGTAPLGSPEVSRRADEAGAWPPVAGSSSRSTSMPQQSARKRICDRRCVQARTWRHESMVVCARSTHVCGHARACVRRPTRTHACPCRMTHAACPWPCGCCSDVPGSRHTHEATYRPIHHVHAAGAAPLAVVLTAQPAAHTCKDGNRRGRCKLMRGFCAPWELIALPLGLIIRVDCGHQGSSSGSTVAIRADPPGSSAVVGPRGRGHSTI